MTDDARHRDPRHRLARGFNRNRLRLEAKRSVRSLVVLVLGVVVGLALLGAILTQLTQTLFRGTQEVEFTVDSAYGVAEKIADVRYKGIRAGKVSEIRRAGQNLVLKVTMRSEYGKLYKDAEAALRPATPLQDVYLDILDRGTEPAGELTGPLALGRTQTSVNIGDVLGVFQADERTQLKRLLDNLGNGLEDRGAALRAAVVVATPALVEATRVADALAGRREQTARLVHNAGILFDELGNRQDQLRTLVRDGAATFGTLQAGSPDLDSTLRELPPTLRSINSSFVALRGVADGLDTAVSSLKPVADRLPSTLTSIRQLDAALGPAVTALGAPVTELVPLTKQLVPVSGDLRAATRALRPQIPAIDKTTGSLAKCERGVTGFFQWNASLSKFGDLRGPIPRGNLAFGVPDSGLAKTKRTAGENCVGGETITGRPTRPEDAE